MLGKLLKYELKATARLFLPLYFGVLALAVINRLFFGNRMYFEGWMWNYNSAGSISWLINTLSAISGFLYGAFIAAMFVMTCVIAIQRFYKNLTGDEGYLMFTLPVPTWTLTASKLLAAGIWTAASVLFTALSILIVGAGTEVMRSFVENFPRSWASFALECGVSIGTLNFWVIVVFLVSIFSWVLPLYFSIALGGHMWPRHRILGAFIAYIVYHTASQIVGSLGAFSYFNAIGMFSNSVEPTVQQMHGLILAGLALSVIVSAGLYTGTTLLLKKKLNLD